MKHYIYEEWLVYVKNEINENDREEMESHLYVCDQCLNNYLQALSVHESALPILADEDNFTDLVMAGVSKQKVPVATAEVLSYKKTNNKKPIYQQAAFHYLLAAAATLLLTFSGVFHSLATYAGAVESPHFQEKKSSVTEGVINKTFAWMDSLEKKEAVKK